MDSSAAPPGRHRASLEYQNSSTAAVAVWIEPWCEELILAPGTTILFESEAGLEVPFEAELEIHSEGVTFWGSGGSTMRAYVDGVLVTECCQEAPLIEGWSVRKITELLFGNPNDREA